MTRADALRALLAKVEPVSVGLVVGAAAMFVAFREPVMFGYLGGIVTTLIVRALIATEDN